jgi:hypothetical protein
MAASGFTPISLYYSTTPAQVPNAGNLVDGELAINIADMKLYAKNSSGVVTVISDAAASGTVTSVATGTGLTGGPITTTGTVSVANNGITDALLRQSAGLSLIGNATNSTANVADITAGTDNQVLRRSGTAIGFGSVNIASTDAVTGTLAAGNGGTGNAFFTVSGPASSIKTYTFPNENMTVVGLSQTQTLTNKRVTPRIGTVADAATITPTGDDSDQYNVTALAQAATIAAPSGTPTNGQKLVLRIKDNGTARALTWTTSSGAYRAIGVTLPTTTVISKTVYIGCIYNAADTFWDVVAVAQQA